MMSAYTKLIDEREVTSESISADREACKATDQAPVLEPGCRTWGILYEGGQRGQMSRWPSGRGAIATGAGSVWGEWAPAIAPDGTRGEDMLYTDDGSYYSEYGEPVCEHGFSLRGDAHRTCDCTQED